MVTVLPSLYEADRLFEENPHLSLQLYQINLSIVFTLLTFLRAANHLIVDKTYQTPTYLCYSDDVTELNDRFYMVYKKLHGIEKHQELFVNLENPQNSGIFHEIMIRTKNWLGNFKSNYSFEINLKNECINGFELQSFKISSEKMYVILVAKQWNLLKILPLNSSYRAGIIRVLTMLYNKLESFQMDLGTVSNNKNSQTKLLDCIDLKKMQFNLAKKIKYVDDPFKPKVLNTYFCYLAGLLPKYDKLSLLLELARFNREQFIYYDSSLKNQYTSSYHVAVTAYLKSFKLHSITKNKIDVLEELFSFGPQSADDFLEIALSIENRVANDRPGFKKVMAILISFRIEYLMLINNFSMAEELINKINNDKINFIK